MYTVTVVTSKTKFMQKNSIFFSREWTHSHWSLEELPWRSKIEGLTSKSEIYYDVDKGFVGEVLWKVEGYSGEIYSVESSLLADLYELADIKPDSKEDLSFMETRYWAADWISRCRPCVNPLFLLLTIVEIPFICLYFIFELLSPFWLILQYPCGWYKYFNGKLMLVKRLLWLKPARYQSELRILKLRVAVEEIGGWKEVFHRRHIGPHFLEHYSHASSRHRTEMLAHHGDSGGEGAMNSGGEKKSLFPSAKPIHAGPCTVVPV